MARLKVTFTTTSAPQPEGSAKAVVGADVEIVMPLGGLIDVAAERTRIQKDIGKAEKEIATLDKKLGNQDFLARAPEEVVAEQRARLAEEKARMQRLMDALTILGKKK
jgi:valyl-tRNA synthetase